MGFGQKLSERSPLIRRIAAWQESFWYPAVYALLCAVSGLHNKYVYLPILAILTVFIVFSALFVKDKKVFLVPMFMVFCSLGSDNTEAMRDDLRTNVFAVFDKDAFICVCILGAIMIGALLIRLFKDGVFAHALKNHGVFIYGLSAISVALLLNGAFSATWRPTDTAFGLFLAFGFVFIYCMVFSMLRDSHDVINYACVCMVCTACLVVVQILMTMLQLHSEGLLIKHWDGLDKLPTLRRENIQLAWGYATNIAGVIALGIPAAMYLARNKRFPILYCFLAVVFWCTTLVIGTRSAYLVGAVIFAVSAIMACFGTKNGKYIRIFSLFLVLGAASAAVYVINNVASFKEVFDEIFEFLRLYKHDDSSRISLWKNGLKDYLGSPVFGVGFSDGGVTPKTEYSNIFSDMYHNIIVEFLGAMGTVGILAFLWHVKDIAVCFFRRFSLNRAILLLIPATVLITSLADNFFFYINFQLFYCSFLVVAERECERNRDRDLKYIKKGFSRS